MTRHLAFGGTIVGLDPPARRTVVVVPHPDDEALASGGLICRQRDRDLDVVVVAVTDGDAAYSDWSGDDLAHVRRREQLEALEHLGVGRDSIERLGLPDGRITDHEGSLAEVLADLVGSDDVLVAPAVFDWHPDHEACGRAAVEVARRRGCTLLGSLFWAHHHPERAVTRSLALAALALTGDETARRRAAIQAHRSQLDPSSVTTDPPIVRDHLLDHLERPVEYYVMAR